MVAGMGRGLGTVWLCECSKRARRRKETLCSLGNFCFSECNVSGHPSWSSPHPKVFRVTLGSRPSNYSSSRICDREWCLNCHRL